MCCYHKTIFFSFRSLSPHEKKAQQHNIIQYFFPSVRLAHSYGNYFISILKAFVLIKKNNLQFAFMKIVECLRQQKFVYIFQRIEHEFIKLLAVVSNDFSPQRVGERLNQFVYAKKSK